MTVCSSSPRWKFGEVRLAQVLRINGQEDGMEVNQTYLGVVQGYTSVEVMSSVDGFDAFRFADIGRHGYVGD